MWTAWSIRQWLAPGVAVVLAGVLYGCSGDANPGPGPAQIAPPAAEGQPEDVPGDAAQAAPDAVPAGTLPGVRALVVEIGDTTHRSEGHGPRRAAPLVIEGEAQLSLDVSGQVDRVEYWLDEQRVAVTAGPGPVSWTPDPGAHGTFYALAWQGHVAVRSPEMHVQRPLPLDIICPNVVLPPPPDAEAAASGETFVQFDLNQLTVMWDAAWNWNSRFRLPLTADPASCADPRVGAILRAARENSAASTEGMLAPLQRRIREETGQRVVLGSAVLAAFESHRATVDVLAMTPELDYRRRWGFRVELALTQDGWQVTDVEEMPMP